MSSALIGFSAVDTHIPSDFHGRVHKGLAKQLAQLLEPHRPLFIEEPLLPGHVNELKDLYNKTSIPIAVCPSPHTMQSSHTDVHSSASDCSRVWM